ncbi:GTPase-activating protein RGD2 [Lachancea thermotolerans CBS 6340]|uniref:KLTH0G19250p n=1 Tax=Lachancea thermotolerans (strain ATCC 56472 / CBS 6340 / NRRL Y-8284) TaxID=559295 RepID=C5DNR6_LACTC|nr:KLTH0G19250p [Lachancea thermotolerans CBS 6340]CAR25427.1 KLTH0G19250p [Lachancea thermotolerans CBS 6340]
MPSFSDSFWTDDLSAGIERLFEELHKGCNQNVLFIQLFASRMQFEVNYGRQLCKTTSSVEGLSATTGSLFSLDIALNHVADAMEEEGRAHISAAADIETTVLRPFSAWCDDHEQRVSYSEKILKTNVSNYQKSKKYVEKLEQAYFNRCRQLEDYKRANYNDEELANAMKQLEIYQEQEHSLAKEREYEKFGKFGNIDFDVRTMRETVRLLLTKLEKSDYKVPFINYHFYNTNNGSEIVKFLMENLTLKDVDQAEAFGQDLLNGGFLKYCNGMGTTFVNSKKFQYSWKPYAYKFAQLSQPNANEVEDENTEESSQAFSDYFTDLTTIITQNQNAGSKNSNLPTVSNTERALFKLIKEMEAADLKYRKECKKIDSLRCSLEELIVDHFTFMEKCELDRLKALEKVVLDFSPIISKNASAVESFQESVLKAASTVDPTLDLMRLVENARTGFFQPRVIPYNNYYNPGGYQNFGIDLETRCRLDKKIVPLIVSSILSYMDQVYPELPNDNVRTTVWTVPVKLHSTHILRAVLNQKPFKDESEVFEKLKEFNEEPSTIASALKIYLLELPEPLISNDVYDTLKALYAEFPPSELEDESQASVDSQRVSGISSAFNALSKPQIATLDAITSHFSRLIKILKMGSSETSEALANEFIRSISEEFANCIIEVKLPDGNDLGYKIFSDLLLYRKPIFRGLKRQNSKIRDPTSSTSSPRSQAHQGDNFGTISH